MGIRVFYICVLYMIICNYLFHYNIISMLALLDFILLSFSILVGIGVLISLWNINIALRIYIDQYKKQSNE